MMSNQPEVMVAQTGTTSHPTEKWCAIEFIAANPI
jgi:hypothetical protein